MSQSDIVTPVATVDTSQCMITAPWFVKDSEFPPTQATYKPLVNGQEAFAAVYDAIANATTSVDIICWGFQPSMYFVRDGKSPCIGELLVKIAREKGVQVRILGWEAPFNTAGIADEANLPGKGAIRVKDRAGQSASEEQYHYDKAWFTEHSWTGEWGDLALEVSSVGQAVSRSIKLQSRGPLFVGRGFDAKERAEIAYRLSRQSQDKDISKMSVAVMTGTATHHQKTVLVDYEIPALAVGFVMGHNMLDEYWDTDAHSAKNRGVSKVAPNVGARGNRPRQDISSRVTGPILEHLHENFATAWRKETGQDLLAIRNAKAVAKQLKIRPELGTPLMAQLLRTQAQEGKRDIEKLYLQSTNNATQFIYIENQYFRWPPLAEAIKNAAALQVSKGRDPGVHGSLHLFVVTNVTDEGIGAGTVNTQRMLDSLGRADTIPELTKLRKVEKVREAGPGIGFFDSENELRQKMEAFEKKIEGIKESAILPEPRPGLKVHICSLVAKDSPPQEWVPVYIHSKLMIINDIFTTHGSANINTRSMQVDSEMNIAHEWGYVTKALRRRLWNMHTGGQGVQDDPEKAFEAWLNIIDENTALQGTQKNKPKAPLIKFNYDKSTLKDWD